MTSPPALLLGLEVDSVRRYVVSSGEEPAGGLVRVGDSTFGAVGVVELLDDEAVHVRCELWVKESPRPWRALNQFGASYRARIQRRPEPRILVAGGLDFETDAGDERFLFGVCGDLGGATAAVLLVDETEEVRVDAVESAGFFCVLFALPSVREGVDPTVALRALDNG